MTGASVGQLGLEFVAQAGVVAALAVAQEQRRRVGIEAQRCRAVHPPRHVGRRQPDGRERLHPVLLAQRPAVDLGVHRRRQLAVGRAEAGARHPDLSIGVVPLQRGQPPVGRVVRPDREHHLVAAFAEQRTDADEGADDRPRAGSRAELAQVDDRSGAAGQQGAERHATDDRDECDRERPAEHRSGAPRDPTCHPAPFGGSEGLFGHREDAERQRERNRRGGAPAVACEDPDRDEARHVGDGRLDRGPVAQRRDVGEGADRPQGSADDEQEAVGRRHRCDQFGERGERRGHLGGQFVPCRWRRQEQRQGVGGVHP